ncbi:MAG TPA: protein kinase [Gemmatimonadales bacterium]|jgi:serine/threonine-protein kinase
MSIDALKAALADRYTIERELGSGGMATVYLAHDIKHDRDVAIKVLRPDIAQTVGADRFLREIQLAAKLNHPSILALFDSGEAGGALFYVMPAVEGESLRDRLARNRMLPVDEAVRIAAAVGGALDYAHRHGVVHRDIKPENILLQDGHALVADFGIGKALSAVEGETFTQTGASVGTPAYMSPEQASGDSVDGRSDIYSLGCVLYEMLVGEQPFTGPTVQAVIAKRFVQTPADVAALREGVPRPIARAVQRALARTPIDRYETGALFVTSLAEVESAPAHNAAPEKSLAVLPFVNMSTDPENEFFADGITEEILNALASIADLRVAGRTSSFSFKGKQVELRAIGELLHVRTVLEGSVRRSGKRVRITAQLSDVADGFRMWSERYDREIEDVFAVQDEIATAIAEKMKATIHQGGVIDNTERVTDNIEAYEAYLKGRALYYRRGSAMKEGLALMQRALALDPAYALAWAGLADGYSLLGYYGMLSPEAASGPAREAAAKALQFGPGLAESHNAAAQCAMLFDWDWPQTERAFRRALEINPGYVQAATWHALFFLGFVSGQWETAIDNMRRLHRSEPISAYVTASVAFTCSCGQHADEGLDWARRAWALDPTAFVTLWSLQMGQYYSGDFAASIATGDILLATSGRHPWALLFSVMALFGQGDISGARAIATEMAARSAREYISPFHRGVAAALVGDAAAANQLLREAVARRDPGIPVFARIVRELPPLQALPASQELLDVLKLPDGE